MKGIWEAQKQKGLKLYGFFGQITIRMWMENDLCMHTYQDNGFWKLRTHFNDGSFN
jgi:hypothetical protein